MRKLVLKTVFITLAVIIAIAGILFGAFAIFSPKIIGEKADKVASYKVACWAYAKQYDKDKDKEAFLDVNYIYKKYAVSLIEDGKFVKATDITVSALEDKYLYSSDIELIKYELEKAMNKKGQTEENKKEIKNCIEKLNKVM